MDKKTQSPTPPLQVNSPALIDELTKLAKEIRNTHAEADKLSEVTRRKAHEAIASAMICGKALVRAKEIVGHGRWLSWLAEHCKGISEKTAQNYMRLSKSATIADFQNLSQAYIGAGIIKEKETPCETTKTKDTPESLKPPEVEPVAQDAAANTVPLHAPTPAGNSGNLLSSVGECVPETTTQPTFRTSGPDAEPEPFGNDPLYKLRLLIFEIMDEIRGAGVGQIGNISVALEPVMEWAGTNGLLG